MDKHLSHDPNNCESCKAKAENEQPVLSGRRYRRHLGETTFAVENVFWRVEVAGDQREIDPLPMNSAALDRLR